MSVGVNMVTFFHKYTEAMSLQIEAIQLQVNSSVETVMQSLQELSASTVAKKEEAERILESTYLNPDSNTLDLVGSIQQSTDDIFELAQQAMTNDPKSLEKISASHSNDDLRRSGGLFSKHMESISTMDDSLKDLLMAMVGNLSNSDVLTQRLAHLNQILKALNVGLGNIIIDFESRLNNAGVVEFKENLLDYTYKTYSTEEERNAFKLVFGPPPSLFKSYLKKTS